MTDVNQDTCIIWDWNGTILDDAEYCVGVINHFLAAYSLQTLTVERYRDRFSFPIKEFYASIGLNLDGEQGVLLAKEWAKIYYNGVNSCRLRKNAKDVLALFSERSISQYIVSAAESNQLDTMVERLEVKNYFRKVLGVDNHLGHGKLHLLECIKGDITGKTVYVIGDTVHDYEISQSIGGQAILISDGHQSAERLQSCSGAYLIKDLSELPALIQ